MLSVMFAYLSPRILWRRWPDLNHHGRAMRRTDSYGEALSEGGIVDPETEVTQTS